jgi:hypothetical protein
VIDGFSRPTDYLESWVFRPLGHSPNRGLLRVVYRGGPVRLNLDQNQSSKAVMPTLHSSPSTEPMWLK